MIGVLYTAEFKQAAKLVFAAFARAFTLSQVVLLDAASHAEVPHDITILVIVEPASLSFNLIAPFLKGKKKVLLFGKLSSDLADYLSVKVASIDDTFIESAACAPAPFYQTSHSALYVRYHSSAFTQFAMDFPITERPCLRYDFQDEWNNLGEGRITADGSIWSIAQLATIEPGHVVASIMLQEKVISSYIASFHDEHAAILWVNRTVGLIDTHEWRLLEYFCSSFLYGEFACLPAICDVPFGYEAAVTMRLDCDEDIASAAFLFERYEALHVPFSLAIHTRLLEDTKHIALMQAVLAKGGAILSHSATHPHHWGGNYAAALNEAMQSKATLEATLQKPIHYAVSPFHETPHYALKALQAAGFRGCVGGIVSANPEFLMARGGVVSDMSTDFVGHSQSCMLHGACLLAESDPLRVYKEAFRRAKLGRAILGYLDHPFSTRYQYNWISEEARAAVHAELITSMRRAGKVLFWNQEDALNFLRRKSFLQFSNGKLLETNASTSYQYAIELGGTLHASVSLELAL